MKGRHEIKAIAYLWGNSREPKMTNLDSEGLTKLLEGDPTTRSHLLALQQYVSHTSLVSHKIKLSSSSGMHRHSSTISTPLGGIPRCEEALVEEAHTVHQDSTTRVQTQRVLEHIERQCKGQVSSVECKFMLTQSEERYHMCGVQVEVLQSTDQHAPAARSEISAGQDEEQTEGKQQPNEGTLCPRPPASNPRKPPAPNKFRPRVSSARTVPDRSHVSPSADTDSVRNSCTLRIRPMTARRPQTNLCTNRKSRPSSPRRRPLTARVNHSAHYGVKSRQPLYRDAKPRSVLSDQGRKLKQRWSAKGYEYLITGPDASE